MPKSIIMVIRSDICRTTASFCHLNLSLQKVRIILKHLYIIRHGETDYNKKGMVQGSGIDAPLNETGFRQSKAFYKAYKDVEFDKIYTTNLIRTQQTVQPFIQAGIPFEPLPALREISWGAQEGRPLSDLYFDVVNQWKQGNYDAKIEGGRIPCGSGPKIGAILWAYHV